MRQIVLDTETTGLSAAQGHRITEIGCLELINRRITGKTFQSYLNPEREVDPSAMHITGLTNEFLRDKPKFVEVVDKFLEFVEGAELIIHNAPFDLSFINHELNLINHPWKSITSKTTVLDTLVLARELYPGQRNNLDALCKRLGVNNTNRKYHGALLDSEILAQVYLVMTRGQSDLKFEETFLTDKANLDSKNAATNVGRDFKLKVIKASKQEFIEHNKYMEEISNNN